jgi:hypothetical protein
MDAELAAAAALLSAGRDLPPADSAGLRLGAARRLRGLSSLAPMLHACQLRFNVRWPLVSLGVCAACPRLRPYCMPAAILSARWPPARVRRLP